MIDLVSTGLSISERLSNKPIQNYGLFAKFLLAVILSCGVDENPYIFLTRSNQPIQGTNGHFGGNLNHYGSMVFAENQGKNNPTHLKTF